MSPLPQLSPAADHADYWHQTRQPLVSLAFLMPLLLTYELGVLQVGGMAEENLRNGADFWMRDWLCAAGLQFAWLLPCLIIVLLLVWHVAGRYRWRVPSETLLGMAAESLLYAFALMVLGQVQDAAFRYLESTPLASLEWTASLGPTAAIGTSSGWVRAVLFIGAGVYEEVLFRLLLLPLLYFALRLLLVPTTWATWLAVLGSSLLFASAHHMGSFAEEFTVFAFTFRTLAGLFFAGLFVCRGFGIAAGCHAAYDILVGVLLTDVL